MVDMVYTRDRTGVSTFVQAVLQVSCIIYTLLGPYAVHRGNIVDLAIQSDWHGAGAGTAQHQVEPRIPAKQRGPAKPHARHREDEICRSDRGRRRAAAK